MRATRSTLDGDDFEPRVATAPSFELHDGRPLVVTWSHPADLTNATPGLRFVEIGNDCERCGSTSLDIAGTITGPDQLTFTPHIRHPARKGMLLIGLSSGERPALECTANACRNFLGPGFATVSSTSR
jgi:hypothetical protein